MNFEIMRAIDGGEAERAINMGLCPTCRQPVRGFRNAISMKEFGISGMCQQCQDSVFGAD